MQKAGAIHGGVVAVAGNTAGAQPRRIDQPGPIALIHAPESLRIQQQRPAPDGKNPEIAIIKADEIDVIIRNFLAAWPEHNVISPDDEAIRKHGFRRQ